MQTMEGFALSGRRIMALAVLMCGIGCTPEPQSTSIYQANSAPKKKASSPAYQEKLLNCEVDLPASWRNSITKGEIPTNTTGGQVGPTSVGPDGSAVFGQLETGTDKYTGAPINEEIVQLDWKSGSWSTVYKMEHSDRDQQVDGAYDGRWFVFAIQHSLSSYHDWSVHAWDSASRKNRTLDEDTNVPYPLVDAFSGKAVWSKKIDRDTTEVYLYGLATDRKTVIARGKIHTARIVGDLIIWLEVPSNGGLEFRAASLQTGSPVETPQGLQGVGQVGQLVASGSTLAWIESNFQTARAWRVGWDEPRTIFDEGPDKEIDDINISGDLVSWHAMDKGQPVYIGDVRTGSCVRLSERGGYVETNKDAMIIVYPSSTKQKYDSFMLRPSLLPPLPKK
ncbi:hypothetical protein [Microtetraspora sp. NBRC 16547]|uniref:hypothetical protein n=1 Tax=Microtetraspora sp. NBRC 16547 TaxID=3030993 RepID=UPI0024A55C58|nr:hypothetical protein [Microtetraspora sp. NBRC 16547]GLW96814.1 hypothetical protein Misp02_09010 [Microtetraspora sp. NBRC 16547]